MLRDDSRRTFVKAATAGLGLALGLPNEAFGKPTTHDPGRRTDLYRRSIVIDSLVLGDPSDRPADAIAAGFTAIVQDLSIYPRSLESATAALAQWTARFSQPGSGYRSVLRGDDIGAAKRDGALGVILGCQDGSILGPSTYSVDETNLRNLERFHGSGLRVLQITHNDRNALGDSYQEKTNTGLSRLGEAVVDRMNRLGMLVDLSHCGERTTLETIARSSRPCAVTHAGCRALYDTGRAKSDAVIRALADKGGYFGVFNMSLWLTDQDRVSVDTVVDHIAHAAKVGGAEHVGFGSDGPLAPNRDLAQYLAGMQTYYERTKGIPGSERRPTHVVVPELDSIHRMERLAAALTRRGFPDREVEGILGGNFTRTFTAACG